MNDYIKSLEKDAERQAIRAEHELQSTEDFLKELDGPSTKKPEPEKQKLVPNLDLNSDFDNDQISEIHTKCRACLTPIRFSTEECRACKLRHPTIITETTKSNLFKAKLPPPPMRLERENSSKIILGNNIKRESAVQGDHIIIINEEILPTQVKLEKNQTIDLTVKMEK